MTRVSVVAILAALAIGCAGGVGTTATSMLRKVKESDDPNVRFLAYTKLGSPRAYDDDSQKGQVASVLAETLAAGQEPVASRAVICNTLGKLRRGEARTALLRAASDPEPIVRAAAARALGQIANPEDGTVLARIMVTDNDRDCQIAAIEALGAMKSPDPRIDRVLVDGMEHNDPAIRLASVEALRSVSGQDLGIEVGPWKTYAEAKAKTAEATVRK